ncbi:dihydrolipoamide acetyltransferase component of pyruvate dehydrogenase complex [Flavimobilis marinus]|uniref:Dihydrolipoamide acetyltransferase component of pyruvate dehydrogenase complex n=1 Tax=Flavimobilis marinus TaxID=285351 RepID=A0A1I2I0E1_9MICO|nr:dihydrolipoamide acetyltransferase family protein [Flavimobilis marinus]GHG49533.1 dihydrolipoamide acetyltransferase component of pyruvate dehydrogenase complex [Flavimobilis marinus]SFF34497.1 pyruvate dehydrogenase E2 component (dihydrolipoamide acetyltransferase) [Flavimobilis marinus]
MPVFETFLLPDAGEGLTEAEIVQWHVAVGDAVSVNQTIVEIETAKSLVELPSPWTGVVSQVLVAEGTTVDVGTPIIVVDVDPGGPPAATSDGGAPAEAATPEAAAGSGNVLVGYGVAAPSARRARRAGAGSTAPGTTPNDQAAATPAAATPPPAAPAPAQPAPSPARAAHGSVYAKPPVRKLAKDLGVDLGSVAPTGPGEIITREDVLAFARQAEGQTLATYPGDDAPWLASGTVSADGRQTRVPVKSVRKRTAEAMVASAFTAPHVTVFQTVDVTRTMRLVERLRADREFADVRVTPLLVTAKALLIALNRHPEVNASWDDEAREIVYKHYVNLGIAAATPRGLVVPNIKDAHRMSLTELARGLADLTAAARAGKTTPADMSDGTITITNVGVFGIDTGTPILNPGEAAILAFGAIREQPWVHKGKIKKRMVTQLALSVDHRLVDGGLASRLLADVAAVLHDPAQALVWA